MNCFWRSSSNLRDCTTCTVSAWKQLENTVQECVCYEKVIFSLKKVVVHEHVVFFMGVFFSHH